MMEHANIEEISEEKIINVFKAYSAWSAGILTSVNQ